MTSGIESFRPEGKDLVELHRQPEVAQLYITSWEVLDAPLDTSVREILTNPTDTHESFIIGLSLSESQSIQITKRNPSDAEQHPIAEILKAGELRTFGDEPKLNDDDDIDFLKTQIDRLYSQTADASIKHLEQLLERKKQTQEHAGQIKQQEYNARVKRRKVLRRTGLAAAALVGLTTMHEAYGMYVDSVEESRFDSYGYTISGGSIANIGETVYPETARTKEVSDNPLLSEANIPDLANSASLFVDRSISPEDGIRQYIFEYPDNATIVSESGCVDIHAKDVTDETQLRVWSDANDYFSPRVGEINKDIAVTLGKESINVCYINTPDRVLMRLEK